MTENKKAWVEPELIVLVRNKPEEAVLTVCKVAGSSGPGTYDMPCNTTTDPCQLCVDLVAS